MDMLGAIIEACFKLLQTPIPLFGFEVSMWQVFLFTALAGLIGKLIGGALS